MRFTSWRNIFARYTPFPRSKGSGITFIYLLEIVPRRWPRPRQTVSESPLRLRKQLGFRGGQQRRRSLCRSRGRRRGGNWRTVDPTCQRKGCRLAIERPTNWLDSKSRSERACNCAAVKVASRFDGTATADMRHMVIEIHRGDDNTLEKFDRATAPGCLSVLPQHYDVSSWRNAEVSESALHFR